MKPSTYERDPRVPAIKIVPMRAQRRQVKRGQNISSACRRKRDLSIRRSDGTIALTPRARAISRERQQSVARS